MVMPIFLMAKMRSICGIMYTCRPSIMHNYSYLVQTKRLSKIHCMIIFVMLVKVRYEQKRKRKSK